MNNLSRLFVWMRRLSYCRGFGVQSPSAYRFIRYVVNEHYPYYAYARLRREFPHVGWRKRKLAELYFRVANFAQASTWIDFAASDKVVEAYVASGCRVTSLHNVVQTDDFEACGTPQVVRATACKGCREFVLGMADRAGHDTIMIVEDIGRSRMAAEAWQALLASGRTSVSFDLYYCGVAFFDTERTRHNYIVNF